MDPLSALGAIAAATQLCAQCVQLSKFLVELYQKAQSPGFIRKHIIQVEQLVKITQLVRANPVLEQQAVAAVLRSCLSTATEFELVLEKLVFAERDGRLVRVQKAFSAMLKEKDFANFFADLERDKSSLILCIQEIDSKLLATIDLKIDEVKFGIDELSISMYETNLNTKNMTEALSQVGTNLKGLEHEVKRIASFSLKKRTTFPIPMPLSGAPQEAENKALFMVPNRRVREFIGREEILTQIKAAFSPTRTPVVPPRVVVIRAMGGQGKTQVALEFCNRVKGDMFQAIFWADATSESTLQKSYETIAAALKPGGGIDPAGALDFIVEELGSWTQSWLLVLDNYDDPILFNNLQDFIPPGQTGGVLVTTRHADTDALTDPDRENAFQLPGLSPSDALELLLKQSRVPETKESREEGMLIVERLAYHPLAITQAGSYIRQRRLRLQDFADHYKRQRKKILEQTPQMSAYRRKLSDNDKETALSVFTTWELSFLQLVARDGAGDFESDILTLFAFFDCKDIAEDMFKAHAKSKRTTTTCSTDPGRGLEKFSNDDNSWDSDAFLDTLVDLEDVSLLQSWSQEPDGCHFSLHPLIKDWILLRTKEEDFSAYYTLGAEIIADYLEAYHVFGDFTFSDAARDAILAHIDAYFDEKLFVMVNPATDVAGNAEIRALHKSYYWFVTFLDLCENRTERLYELASKVFKWREETLGPEDPLTLDILGDYAEAVFSVKQEESEAIALDHRLIKGCEVHYGKMHLETLSAYGCLLGHLVRAKRLVEAQTIDEEYIKPLQQHFGLEDPESFTALVYRAEILRQRGSYAAAEDLLRQTFALAKSSFGTSHGFTAVTSRMLAGVLHQEGKYKEEETVLLAAAETSWSTASQLIGSGLYTIYLEQGRFAEAEPYLRTALETYIKLHGKDHEDVRAMQHALAETLRAQGKNHEAEDLFRSLIEVRQLNQAVPADKSFHVTLFCFGKLLARTGRPAEAADMYRQCRALRAEQFGEESAEVAEVMEKLGRAQLSMGQYLEAEQTWHNAAELLKRIRGPNDELVLDILKDLRDAGVLSDKGESHSEALAILQRTLCYWDKLRGDLDPEMLPCLWSYVSILEAAGQHAERVSILRRIIRIQEQIKDFDGQELNRAQEQLSRMLEEVKGSAGDEKDSRLLADDDEGIALEELPKNAAQSGHVA